MVVGLNDFLTGGSTKEQYGGMNVKSGQVFGSGGVLGEKLNNVERVLENGTQVVGSAISMVTGLDHMAEQEKQNLASNNSTNLS